MNTQSSSFKIKLGIFIMVGIALFTLAIFIIGKQKNLFDPVFTLKSNFKNVSGLQVGNTVRFSGINVGTIDNIRIVNDTTVTVVMLIRKEIQKFIKADSEAAIGSEGLIGDRLITISSGAPDSGIVKNGQLIGSSEPVETDEIMQSLQVTAGNAAIASAEIAEILVKVNTGNGTLGRLINDQSIANNIDQTIKNLKSSTKGLDENMEAAKHNFLLRGYFKKKEKEAEKKRKEEEAARKKAEAKAERDARRQKRRDARKARIEDRKEDSQTQEAKPVEGT